MNVLAGNLTRADVKQALQELDQLSIGEYGIPLEELLLDDSPRGAQRMQRLTGIVLKHKFATMESAPAYSTTGAKRAWP